MRITGIGQRLMRTRSPRCPLRPSKRSCRGRPALPNRQGLHLGCRSMIPRSRTPTPKRYGCQEERAVSGTGGRPVTAQVARKPHFGRRPLAEPVRRRRCWVAAQCDHRSPPIGRPKLSGGCRQGSWRGCNDRAVAEPARRDGPSCSWLSGSRSAASWSSGWSGTWTPATRARLVPWTRSTAHDCGVRRWRRRT